MYFLQDLQGTSLTNFNSELSAGWSTDTGGTGGYFNSDLTKSYFSFTSDNPWTWLQKTYSNLDDHDFLSFSLEAWITGPCTGNVLQISFDDVPMTKHFTATSLNISGSSQSFYIKGGIPHSGSTVNILFESQVRTLCTSFTIGIRALNINFMKSSNISQEILCHTLLSTPQLTPICGCDVGQYGSPCTDCIQGCNACGGAGGVEACSECDASNNYTWDGEICEGCALYCDKCVLQMGSDCTSCLNQHWIYEDGTCLDSCPSPMKKIPAAVGEKVDSCKVPCESSEWLYKDLVCRDYCDYKEETDSNGIRWCKSPCDDEDDYYYEDKETCKGSCGYPNEAEDIGGIKTCSLGIDEGEAEQVKGMSKGINGANTGSSGAIAALSFLSSSDSTLICMGAFSKMLQYIKYMSIAYPAKVELMLEMTKSNSSTNGFASKMMGKALDKFPDRGLPEKFEYYGVRSSFFVNYWPSLFILLVLGSVTGLVISLGLSLKKISPKMSRILSQVTGILKWNMLLLMFCGDFGDIVFFTALELTTEKLNSFESVVSLASCIITNIFAFWVMAQILTVNFNIRKFKPGQVLRGQEIEVKWGNYKTLFAIYKDQSYFQQIFMFIFIVRVSIFNTMIGYFFNYPLFQVITITLTNTGMLLYLLFKRPMRAVINFLQQVVLEGFLFVFNVCLCILAGLDHSGVEAYDFRDKVGEVMMIINIIVPVVSVVILGVKFLILGIKAYKEWKAGKEANSKKILERDISIERPRKQRARGPGDRVERRNVELAVTTMSKSSHVVDMSSSDASFINNNSDAWPQNVQANGRNFRLNNSSKKCDLSLFKSFFSVGQYKRCWGFWSANEFLSISAAIPGK